MTFEQAWWDNLPDELVLANTAGDPPYDLDPVVARILGDQTPTRVLDLGCGVGRLTSYVASRLPDVAVHGVDISTKLLHEAYANRLPNTRFWHCNGRGLPLGLTGQFDLSYAVTVFQHMHPREMWGYLREISERLTPGSGRFVFTIALGESAEFLNYQIPDVAEFCNDLIELFDSVAADPSPDVNGWTWVEART